MDNYSTYKTKEVKAWLARHLRYRVHFTPISASWLNQVERWFAELINKQIKRGVYNSVKALEADIDAHNGNQVHIQMCQTHRPDSRFSQAVLRKSRKYTRNSDAYW